MTRLTDRLFAVACLMASPACRASTAEVTAVESALRAADTTAVLIMAPSDCIACNNAIGAWLAWGEVGATRRTIVLLTEKPTAQETKLLRSTRIRWAGILARHSKYGTDPLVYFAINGTVRDSARGQLELIGLMRRVSPRR